MKFRVNGSNEIMTFDGTNQRVGDRRHNPIYKVRSRWYNHRHRTEPYKTVVWTMVVVSSKQPIWLLVGTRFAVCKGRDATISAQRAFGEFLINDVDSGRHGSCRLNATHFSLVMGTSIQVFAYNFYSVAVFDELRIKDGGYLFPVAALQVYVSNANNNLETYMTMSEQNPVLGSYWTHGFLDTDNTGHDAILGLR